MSNKQKKKRNKKYTGADAAVTKPTIVRVSAVDRSTFGQWWFEHRRIVKPVAVGVLIAAIIAFCIVGLIQLLH